MRSEITKRILKDMQNGCSDYPVSATPARPQSIIVETILELSNINADLERRIDNVSKDRAKAHRVAFDLEAQLKTTIEDRDYWKKLADDKNKYIEDLKASVEKAQAGRDALAGSFDLVVDQRDQLKKQNRKLSRELVKLMKKRK